MRRWLPFWLAAIWIVGLLGLRVAISPQVDAGRPFTGPCNHGHPCTSPTPLPTPTSTPTPTATSASGLVVRNGQDLAIDGQRYRFAGANIYNANSVNTCWYTLGQGTDLATMLNQAPGVDVFRSWFYTGEAGTPQTRDWTKFDHTLNVAGQYGRRVIVVLEGEWGDCGGYPVGTRKTRSWFESGYRLAEADGQSYRDYVREVIGRYGSNPNVLSFELISEPEAPEDQAGTCNEALAAPAMRSWATDMAAVAKSLTVHLVTVGTIGSGQCGTSGADYQGFFATAGIDACDYHDYGSPGVAIPGDQWNGLALRFSQCAAVGKPFIVSEAGITGNEVSGNLQTRANDFNAKLDAWWSNGVDGATPWNYCILHDPAYGQCDSNSYDFSPGDPVLPVIAAH